MATDKIARDARFKREFARLSRIFKNLSKDQHGTALSLIRNAAFMTVELEDLQQRISEQGVVVEYQNGENQWGTKKSPEVDVYNTMIKNHLAVIKHLCDLMPTSDEKGEADALMSFVKKARA